ncbi:MAG: hypothetical protein QOK02_1336, partial [Mycobacterium sp.]|nr:hypothetical protein [Mycobacterium sp.]
GEEGGSGHGVVTNTGGAGSRTLSVGVDM